MIFIIITVISIYFILLSWTWQSLGFIDKSKKVAFIFIGILIMYGITWIVFQIAKGEIDYQSKEIQNNIQNILIAIFTGINGIIVMPQIGKILDKIKENEIEKEKIIKKIVILVVVFMACLIFENTYMRDTQEGILEIYHTMNKQ